jgi:predicted dehydrogenase
MNSVGQTAAPRTKGEVDLYSSESGPGESLEDLSKRKDISGFIIALQNSSQRGYIERAIKAGKHVLAEKLIAPNVEAAQRLMETLSNHPAICSIAENYKFIPKLAYAARIAEEIG